MMDKEVLFDKDESCFNPSAAASVDPYEFLEVAIIFQNYIIFFFYLRQSLRDISRTDYSKCD